MKNVALLILLTSFTYSFSQIYVNETFPSIGAWTTTGTGSSGGTYTPADLWLHDLDGSNGFYSVTNSIINSPTVGNGFMILDADWFNSPPPPTSETFHASLNSPVYDLSANTNVELRFHQLYRTCCGPSPSLFVDVTTDGFANVISIPVDYQCAPTNVSSGTVEHIISLENHIQGNPSNVQIAFRFGEGGSSQNNSHYYWMIDDVIIQATPLHEQLINNNNVSLANFSNLFGQELEYSKTPLSQIGQIRTNADVYNYGQSDEAGTALHTQIWDGAMNQVYNQTSTGQMNLSYDTLNVENLWTPSSVVESYKILNQLTYNNVASDDDPSNNTSDTAYFEISEYEYARDEIERDTVLTTLGDYNYGTPPTIATASPGNIFYFDQDDTLFSVKFAAENDPQMQGATVSVFVVKDPGDSNEVIITQDSITAILDPSDLTSNINSLVWKEVFINGGLPLEGGHTYYVGLKVTPIQMDYFLTGSVTDITSSTFAFQDATGALLYYYDLCRGMPCPAIRAITKGYIQVDNVVTTVPTSCGTCDGQIDVTASSITGSGLSYQWYLNGNILAGETSPTLNNACAGHNELVITHPSGSELTESIHLTAAGQINPEICIVTIDSITGLNKVVWEKPISSAIDSFYVYRSDVTNNIYTKIGATDYADLAIWIDQGANPDSSSYRYKVSLVDSCSIESDLSDFHQTFHLTSGYDSLDNKYYLHWDPYIGVYFDSVLIYRGTTPTNLSLLATVVSTQTSFVDTLPPLPAYYQVVVYLSNPCDPTKAGYQVIRSNISGTSMLNLAENALPSVVKIFPNPSQGRFKVEHSGEGEIEVYDFTGRMILNTFSEGKTEIDLSRFDSGVYLLRLGNNTYRIIKE